MDIEKGLHSTLTWTRACALYLLSEQDLLKPEVFSVVLNLLDDTTLITIPRDARKQEELELIKLLKKSPVQPVNKAHSPVPTISMLCDLARYALDKTLPGTDKTLSILISHALENKFKTKLWIDQNFWNFSWHLPAAAFKRYLKAVTSDKYTYILKVLKKAQPELIRWAIDFALDREPVLTRVLEIFARDNIPVVLERINSKAVKKPALLALLTEIAGDDSRALAVMRDIEKAGYPAACGYMAIYDIRAAGRFRDLLKDTSFLKKKEMEFLIAKVCKVKPYPAFFPLEEMVHFCDPDFILKHLNDNVPVEIQKNILLVLINNAGQSEQVYYPLYRLAKIGGIGEDPHLSDLFWVTLREKLQSFLPPSQFDHPLVKLAVPGLQPLNFRENVINFVADNLIQVSFALKSLGNPVLDEQEKPVIRAAIIQEVHQVKELWEREKKERFKYPSRYWYFDRQSPTSALFSLEERWVNLRKTAADLGMHTEVKLIDELCAIDWKKELIALTDSGSH